MATINRQRGRNERESKGQGQDLEQRKRYGPYIKSLLEQKVFLKITDVGNNIKPNLERIISSKVEGKCTVEGYIKPDSVQIINYSSGKVNGEYVEYHAMYECMVCHPVEGLEIECTCKTLTKAGIHAEVIDQAGNIPITIFISRDHHMNHHEFGLVKETGKILVKIIGIRFELNDPFICAIGKLLQRVEDTQKRLTIHE
jgi:DNA-directed RNA polymerase subunit E'/Rpb7